MPDEIDFAQVTTSILFDCKINCINQCLLYSGREANLMAAELLAGVDPAPVVQGVLEGFAKTLSKSAGRVAKKVLDETIVDFRIGFNEYLKTSYARCRYFKTILDPMKPLEVATHYVHATLTCGNTKVNDDDLIASLASKKG
jgi:hypothetical protein